MRHGKKLAKLSRKSSHRMAMLRYTHTHTHTHIFGVLTGPASLLLVFCSNRRMTVVSWGVVLGLAGR